jgi:hypothetical protein
MQRIANMPKWERRRYDEKGRFQPLRGYTPPGSYKPPEITGLTPPTESREGVFSRFYFEGGLRPAVLEVSRGLQTRAFCRLRF